MQEIFERVRHFCFEVWRFRWYAIGMACLIVPLGWVAVSKMPVTYRASTKVYVDTHTVFKPLLEGIAMEDTNETFISLMARELASRPNVERVARILGLDDQLSDPQQRESLLGRLERSVGLTALLGERKRRGGSSDLYTISYQAKTPELAVQTVEAFIAVFKERVEGESQRDSNIAKQFLAQKIEEQQEKMKVAENRIREFKQKHLDLLPKDGVNVFQRLHAEQAAVDNIDLEIAAMEYRRSDLQSQLASISATGRAISSDGKTILSPLEGRMFDAQTRLDELSLKYTDEHPDVIAAKRNLAQLKRQVQGQQAQAQRAQSGSIGNLIPNPVYQQLEATLRQVESEIAALQLKRNEYVRRVEKLRKQSGPVTRVEADLQALTREYEAEKEKLGTLVSRQDAANMTGSVKLSGGDVRFKVIDPARVANAGAAEARKQLIMAAGVPVASLVGGVGFAILLSLIWPVIYGRRSLGKVANLPVFGSISQVMNHRMRIRKYFSIAAVIIAVFAILAVHATAVLVQNKQIALGDITVLFEGTKS